MKIFLQTTFLAFVLLYSSSSNTNAEDLSSTVIRGESLDFERAMTEVPDFCWKDTYTRGAGTIPDACAPGREKIGALCYTKCPSGYSRVGFDCHQNCPSDMSNQGLFCRLTEYGRGAGYPWRFEDGFSNNGMLSRCQRDHGVCEMWGAVAYPKCKAGYAPAGCCICRPNPPNCAARGLGGQFDLSCAKKVIIGDPVPMTCASGKQMDAGLCYTMCNPNYAGVGPICWGKAPNGMVDCGMGAASDSAKCAEIIVDQVMSVGETALFIGSLGSSGGITGMVKGSTKYIELTTKYSKMIEQFKAVKETTDWIQKGYDANSALKDLIEVNTTEPDPIEMVRVAAELAALVDPSGVSSIVAAYTYPICGKLP